MRLVTDGGREALADRGSWMQPSRRKTGTADSDRVRYALAKTVRTLRESPSACKASNWPAVLGQEWFGIVLGCRSATPGRSRRLRRVRSSPVPRRGCPGAAGVLL